MYRLGLMAGLFCVLNANAEMYKTTFNDQGMESIVVTFTSDDTKDYQLLSDAIKESEYELAVDNGCGDGFLVPKKFGGFKKVKGCQIAFNATGDSVLETFALSNRRMIGIVGGVIDLPQVAKFNPAAEMHSRQVKLFEALSKRVGSEVKSELGIYTIVKKPVFNNIGGGFGESAGGSVERVKMAQLKRSWKSSNGRILCISNQACFISTADEVEVDDNAMSNLPLGSVFVSKYNCDLSTHPRLCER